MRGRIITSSHRVYDLPVLLRWNMTYTGSVPCDSYTVTCVYDKTMAEPLHLAAGFLALKVALSSGINISGILIRPFIVPPPGWLRSRWPLTG